MPVSKPHSDYDKAVKSWILVADCVEGEAAIKRAGTAYLPKPNQTDASAENQARYNAYTQRASFQNVTARTKNTLLGAAFRKEPKPDIPDLINYILESSTKNKLPLLNLLKKSVGEVLEKGRYGILVEYPPADKNLTKAEVEKAGLRAHLAPYEAEDIINWRMAKGRLTLVVLQETRSIEDDGFTETKEIQYRVLRLVEGVYSQQLYDKGGEPLGLPVMPLKADGKKWDEIPFAFMGAENNDADIDTAPLYDMAIVNIAHYRNSADYEESLFLVGQPTPVIAGLDQGWVDENMNGGLHIGSRAVISLPKGADAKLLQAGANTMPMEGMEHKEKQMVALGARLIQPSGGVETAYAAKVKYSADSSVLAGVVDNVEDAMRWALRWVAEYMGADPIKVEIELNKIFFEDGIDPQVLTGLVPLIDRGAISIPVAREHLRKTGLIAEGKTDEEIDAEIEAANPIGGTGAAG